MNGNTPSSTSESDLETNSPREILGDVRHTFDRIAPHFSETRRHAWPAVEEFINSSGGRVGLDLGCGNGRHAEVLADRMDRTIGIDLSRGELQQARARSIERDFDMDLVQATATDLPLRSGRIDVAVYIATLHHIPSRGLRAASLDELGRVLATSGRALISVWSVTHDRFDRDEAFDTEIGWTLPTGETVDRYYHIYDRDEFRTELSATDLSATEIWEEAGNCYAIVRPSEQ